MITPDGETHRPRARVDSALVMALARAHRWQRLLESGECASITELAAAEKIDRSYLCRVLRLTLLAPDVVEAIMEGRQAEGITVPGLMKGFPVEWELQFTQAASASGRVAHAMPNDMVRYAKSGELNIAYQITGRGPRDLVLIAGFVSHLDLDWAHPAYAHFLTRLASFSRLIRFDKRGTGLSDRPGGLPDLETRMDDVRAVMDAANSHRATVFGYSEGGPMAILFAATFPERTEALVIYGSYARRLVDDDYPWGKTPEARTRYARQIEDGWGWEADMHTMCPSADESMAAWWGARARAAASPGAARALIEMNSLVDVRAILPSIQVPTLVIHRTGDHDSRIEEGRYIASHIPGAKFVEIEGADHFPSINPDQIVDEVELFVTGNAAPIRSRRRLATILFVDIVDSTSKANATGDEQWSSVLESFEETARRELKEFRGELVKTMGDGFLATFDGPARAVRCGCAIRDASRDLGLDVRCGIDSAEVEDQRNDIVGIGVNVAARVCQVAARGEVWASRTVKDLLAGSGIDFDGRGEQVLKGFREPMSLFAARA